MRNREIMHKKRILVIDDDHAVRAMICENLRDCGYDVAEADNGDTGLAQMDAKSLPDLVITDIIMPKKEGLETIMEMRRKFPRIKLLAISCGSRTRLGDVLSMAEKLGSDATLPKPLNMPLLEETVERLVGSL